MANECLPSGDAVFNLLDGKPGALPQVLESLALRGVWAAGGLYVAGFRGNDLVKATLASILAIELGVFVWAATKK